MGEEGVFPPDDWVHFGMYCALCLGIVLFAGLMAGLTIGYFSIEKMDIALLKKGAGTDEEIRMMDSLRSLLSKKHELLVTLLLCNSLAMESLPIFLDQIFPSWAAILFSVVFVLIFGEILPQAICATNPLKFGYRFSCLVKCLKFLLYPVVWPLGKMLDCILGEHNAQFLLTQKELKCLIQDYAKTRVVEIHGGDDVSDNGNNPDALRADAWKMLKGAYNLLEQSVEDAMSPWDSVATLPEDLRFDSSSISKIVGDGYSRYPVIGKHAHDVKGYVLTNQILPLMIIQGKKKSIKTVKNLNTWTPLYVSPETTCFDCLNIMQHERKHMAFVTAHKSLLLKCRREGRSPSDSIELFMGIITMEDLIEKLIQEDVYDETDYHPLTKKAARAVAEKLCTPDAIIDKFFDQLKKKREGKAMNARFHSNITSQYLSRSTLNLMNSEEFSNSPLLETQETYRDEEDHATESTPLLTNDDKRNYSIN